MKRLIGVMALLCIYTNCFAQNIKPLTIGDTVPDIALNHILNYKTPTARLSDFKGKLLVLDFWDTWCTACIGTFPHNHELQQEYGNKIQILNVGFQTESTIKTFLSSLEKRNGPSYIITTVTDDSLLSQMFPHRYIPHLVWIGADGVVKAITAAEKLTKENIDKILENKPADFQQKKDISLSIPLFLPSVVTDSPFNMVHYSLLINGGNYDGAGSGQYYFKRGNDVYGCNYTNRSLENICMRLGYRLWEEYLNQHFNQNRLEIEINDSAALSKFEKQNWQFSFLLSKNESDSFYFKALKEISHYTGYMVSVEKRTIPCLVLTRIGKADKLATQKAKPMNNLFSIDSSRLTNLPFYVFVNFLDDANITNLPVIDETGYKNNIDIALNSPYTLESIKKQLQRYGLALTKAQREINVLTIKLKDK